MENAPGKFHRLKPGGEVRLRYAFIIKCERVVKDAAGNIVELRCSHDPASRSGSEESGRKVKGTIHWVSAKHARRAPVRLYDRLFSVPFPGDNLTKELNPESLKVVSNAGSRRGPRSGFSSSVWVTSSLTECSRIPARRFSTEP